MVGRGAKGTRKSWGVRATGERVLGCAEPLKLDGKQGTEEGGAEPGGSSPEVCAHPCAWACGAGLSQRCFCVVPGQRKARLWSELQ